MKKSSTFLVIQTSEKPDKIPTRMAQVKKTDCSNDSKDLQQLNSQTLLVGIQSGSITSKTVSQFPIIHLSYDPEGCISSPCLFNLYVEYIMRNTGLEEAQAVSGLLGEISITSDMQMPPLLWQKVKRNSKAS